jgi:hypothetical protein
MFQFLDNLIYNLTFIFAMTAIFNPIYYIFEPEWWIRIYKRIKYKKLAKYFPDGHHIDKIKALFYFENLPI